LKPKSNPVAYCNVDSHLSSGPPKETNELPLLMSIKPSLPGFNPF